MAASGLGIQEVIQKYLFDAYGMTESSCLLPSRGNPQLAICLNTTAHDYEQFLSRTLSYQVH